MNFTRRLEMATVDTVKARGEACGGLGLRTRRGWWLQVIGVRVEVKERRRRR